MKWRWCIFSYSGSNLLVSRAGYPIGYRESCSAWNFPENVWISVLNRPRSSINSNSSFTTVSRFIRWWMVEMVHDRIAAGETTVVSTAAVLRCGKRMEKLPHYNFSWTVSLQKICEMLRLNISSRSHSLENSVWKGLWTCRETDKYLNYINIALENNVFK
jgi:hypothetical protein